MTPPLPSSLRPMTRAVPLLALLLALAPPAPAQEAACYADYKASQPDPLRLHYGVIALDGDCTPEAAEAALAERLPAEWNLLEVVGVFGPEDLERRRESAGDYFLRF